ncbi:ABC transporter ATP-binding protein [Limosilactobacillus mucosae]|uniref:Peptide ABC transporter ATP-binding protein n=2 Tax=Limosilactobacillus mucosae TaxID=97478 RepID=A0A0D4CMS3_LIMMU|nr:ABC transporter ATP-binding protein [Limosilactobacillus mucosae]MDO5012991.1 ABC transporter ATP-binding protein [Lactobacillaceae bacterium]AJT51403.1 peptide ABC transporter ATP-binding protein [Limosilactobacillus mucosae LM1]MCI1489809.1 ABC transporter ATP-binding protein [Limosilactobacillus mucosae]MCI1526750.1 ABC transporter ATP-binding protein [Limosilactobacillus mucosae]MCI6052426.1 ABC transporter ATP-binding protein [Limosilactobacillus mucosae]
MIRLEHVNKYYGQGATRFHVLHDINLQVAAGELMAIIGESGSGKSTLINIIGFLDDDFEGNYFYNDQAIHDYTRADFAKLRNQHVGFVFQNFKLIRDISIAENVILPLLYAGVGRRQAKKTAARVLSRVGLGGYDDKLPTELSGGQQQRVSIARAIIANPDFLIADEPTGALDTKTSQEIMDLFKQLNQTQHTTIIMVTHDPRVAEQCERVVKIIDGRIVDDRKVGAN